LASLNRSNLDPAMTISALRQDAQQPPENGSAQDPGSPQKRNVNPQENQNQFGNYFQEQGSNTAGRVTRSMQNQKGQSVSLEDTSSSGQRKQSFGDQSQPQTPAPTPPNQAPSPKKDHSVKEDDSSQKQEGPQTTIAGMRVTLLTLTQEEKDSVVAKVLMINVSWNKLDQLICESMP
jgi:hypothetical protein